jgi:hypothetical protein
MTIALALAFALAAYVVIASALRGETIQEFVKNAIG